MSLADGVAEAIATCSLVDTADTPTQAIAPIDAINLTRREAEVLRLLAAGLSDREIAESLSLSPRTIGGHITNLLTKLNLDSRTVAAVFAVRHGLV
jgi:DNA-binding NarL/FixJ family response regulator